MLKYNEEQKRNSINGALNLRKEINDIIDPLFERGFSNICWFGIGGTYGSAMQVYTHMKELTSLEIICENAAEYLTTGNKRINAQTIVVISSVTGSTEEMTKGVERLKEVGATIIGFIDKADAQLAHQVDYLISYPENEQLKFFMTADRLMYLNGEFNDYEDFYNELDRYLAEGLITVAKEFDEKALEIAKKHHDDELHYFIGAGSQWGATYSHAMCYWEEQHWLKARPVHASDFFHGLFEVITKDSAVTLFMGEDNQRPLTERVLNFLPRICSNYTVIDTKEFALTGISEKYRGYLSHLVIRTINDRIDAHVENINKHPMDIRRYYRQLDY